VNLVAARGHAPLRASPDTHDVTLAEYGVFRATRTSEDLPSGAAVLIHCGGWERLRELALRASFGERLRRA
jgi:hypothetical protein